jgi:hypothetical protein
MHNVIARLLPYLMYVEPVCCAMVIYLLIRSKASREYIFFVVLLWVRLTFSVVGIPLVHFANKTISMHGIISPIKLYAVYFYLYWGTYAVEAILSLLVIYSIFKLAMAPLQGLQNLGMLIFRWVTAISIAVALGVAFTPHLSGAGFLIAMVTQLQQTSSILTLCLLLFVCFAIRPMGLTFRSRIFGVSLGLGFLAAVNLVDAAWISHSPFMDSAINLFNGSAIVLALLNWSAYFAFPEPKRRIMVLPTTSPFLRWNQISLALGDEPGYVAVGGISPDLFAPAELEVMRRASAKMASSSLDGPSAIQSLSA